MKKIIFFAIFLGAAVLLSSCYTIVRNPADQKEKLARSEADTETKYPDQSALNYQNYIFLNPQMYPYYYNRNWFYDDYWNDFYSFNRFYRYRPYRNYYYDWYGYSPYYFDPFYNYYSPYNYYYGYYDYYGNYYYPYGYYYRYYGGGSGGSGGSSSQADELNFARPTTIRQREVKSQTNNDISDYLNLPMSSSSSSRSAFSPGAGGTSSVKPVSLAPESTTEPAPAATPISKPPREHDVAPVERKTTQNTSERHAESPSIYRDSSSQSHESRPASSQQATPSTNSSKSSSSSGRTRSKK